MMMEIDDDHEDHVNNLPDNILVRILSLLKIRETVGTSLISKRFTHVWKTTHTTTMVLDADNILDRHKYAGDIDVSSMECPERFLIKMKRVVEFMQNAKHYVNSVKDHIEKIEDFKVCFTIRNDVVLRHHLVLNMWVRFAMERHVEGMELWLLEEENNNYFSAPIINGHDDLYIFPCHLINNNNSLKRLRLAHCQLAVPHWSVFSGFNGITTLELCCVDLVSRDHVQHVLRSLRSVEILSLKECGKMEFLRIEYPDCQKIKFLSVCDCPNLKAIQLNTLMNLENLEYKGRIVDFSVFNVPRLMKVFSHVRDPRVVYSDMWPISRLPIDLPWLQTLLLESRCHMSGLMSFPKFQSLQSLIILKKPAMMVPHDVSWIITFLKACPTLQRLELHLRTCYNYVEEEDLRDITKWYPRCVHDELKEVVITGVHGHLSEIEIAMYLLNNATSLERMIIDPKPKVYIGNNKWNVLEASESWTRIGKPKVHHYLTQQLICLPSSLQLMIL